GSGAGPPATRRARRRSGPWASASWTRGRGAAAPLPNPLPASRGEGIRIRQVDDDLAGAHPAELVARDALDGGRVGAQRLGLAREPVVLGRQLLVVNAQRGQIP